jgi:tetratricopeptide (TPR) repeat protein
MSRRAIAIVFAAGVFAASAAAQDDNELLRNIDHVLGRGDKAPTVDELLGDVLERIRTADALGARATVARLRENEAELRLYESLLKQVRAGLLVDVPKVGPPAPSPSPEAVALEKRKVGELARQLRDAERDLKRAADSRPAKPAGEVRPTTMSDAILDVLVEVPSPPEGTNGLKPALDPRNLGRALFQAGDFAGALEALKQVPEDQLTPEDRFRRARALDQLGRIGEARAAYEAVAAAEKDGAFGRQAAWMLKLARTREQVAGAIARTESRPQGGKK